MCRDGQVKTVHHVLNECLLDRGSSPSMVSMECFIDGYHLTNIIVRSLLAESRELAASCNALKGCSGCRQMG